MDTELERLEAALRLANENLMRFLHDLFGAEDDPRALEILRLSSQKDVAENALVNYMLDTMSLDEIMDPIPPPPPPKKPMSGDSFLH